MNFELHYYNDLVVVVCGGIPFPNSRSAPVVANVAPHSYKQCHLPVKGISMETPTLVVSIEISRTRPYSSKIKM